MFRNSCILLALSFAAPAWAQIEAAPAVAETPGQVLVVGQRPGPGLWKISKGEHVLWQFASYSPLPEKMQWRSQQVEAIVAQSQQYLAPPSAGTGIGVWGALKLMPHVIGMRKNPNGAMLRDVVAPDVYARWLVLKAKYGVSDAAESERPIFAAETLYRAGLQHAGLSTRDEVARAIEQLVKKNKTKVMHSHVALELADPTRTLKDFKKGSIDDAACFAKTIERLESDIDAMRVRANGEQGIGAACRAPAQRACLARQASRANTWT